MDAYWINTFREIRDPEKLDAYVALAGPAMRAVAAYESPAYQEALAALGDGADRDIRIVEALGAPFSDGARFDRTQYDAAWCLLVRELPAESPHRVTAANELLLSAY